MIRIKLRILSGRVGYGFCARADEYNFDTLRRFKNIKHYRNGEF